MKIVDWVKNKWFVATSAVASLATSAMAQDTASNAVAEALEDVETEFLGLIEDSIPVIIGIVAASVAIFAIFAAIRWLKKALKSGSN